MGVPSGEREGETDRGWIRWKWLSGFPDISIHGTEGNILSTRVPEIVRDV